MATISNIETSGFFGLDEQRMTPITVSVTATNPANATFHRVRLKVTIGSVDYEFSTPVTANATVLFDIASAFISAYDGYSYTSEIPVGGYPTYTATVYVAEDYMVDGVLHEGTYSQNTVTVKACPGLLTDLERLTGTRPSYYGRKPTSSPEVCFTGSKHLIPGALVTGITPTDPACTEITVPAGASVPSGSPLGIYGITAPADGYEIRFINSLGVHENVFVTCLRTAEVDIHTDKYAIAQQETVGNFSRTIARKSNDRERWKMTSGPLNEQWQQWYLHEFLMADHVWIKVGSNYLPVHILPEETVKGIDRTKPDMLTVDFTIEFDINGNPFA